MVRSQDAQVAGLGTCTATQIDEGRVRATRPLLLTPEESSRIADAFSLLSDPGRVRVVFALLLDVTREHLGHSADGTPGV